jgi:hypothetical protein
MSTIRCNQFLNQLEQWMEGERSSDAQAHARECAQCRGFVADLDAIHQSASSLALDDPEPPARLWISLRAQLAQEGIIRGEKRGRMHRLKELFEGTFTATPRPALAGAYLVALVAVGGALVSTTHTQVSQVNDDRWMSGMQSSTQPLSAQLDSAEQDAISSMPDSNPVVTASLHKNLAIVDNYIALCEKNMHEDPQSEMARDYLYQAYQQKADLIAQMSERGEGR